MRKFLIAAATALALSVSACGQSGETYQVAVGDAWSKVESSGYGLSSYGLPAGLLGTDVQAVFEAVPGDRAAYWKFTRKGKELARLNVAVEGDQSSSTVSYSYATGDVSGDDQKIEQAIRQIAQPLFVEAVDATMENRSPDQNMKNMADAESTKQLIGQAVKETYSAIDKARRESDASLDETEARALAAEAEAQAESAGRPATDLNGY
jgi:hypothetical protein